MASRRLLVISGIGVSVGTLGCDNGASPSQQASPVQPTQVSKSTEAQAARVASILKIKHLKTFQASQSYARIEFMVINQSQFHISFWSI